VRGRAAERLRASGDGPAVALHDERQPQRSAAPAALQLGDPRLQARELGPLAMAIALELTQQLRERRRDQPQHRPPEPRHERPGRAPPGRGGRLGQAQRRERRVAGGPPELQQEGVRVRLRGVQ
jgi:hypothetical protein